MTDETIKGPAYPFVIDPATGGVSWSTGRQKLTENIRLILGMRIGERPMNRNFGTPIRDLLQEANDGGLARLIARHARETLTQLEPRIFVTDVQFSSKGGELVLQLRYAPADRPQSETISIALE